MNKPVISGDTISIPSNAEYLNDVDVFVEGLLRGFGVSESIVADIAISVSELVNNAINHGNKGQDGKQVSVRTVHKEGEVCITVTDKGNGFDPSTIASPIADENLLKDVGRGLFIVKSLMDKLDIKPTSEGTTVSITKSV